MIINPAKELHKYLNNVHIGMPDLNSLNRLSDTRKQLYIISNSKDIFSSVVDDLIFDVDSEDAFKGLASQAFNFSKSLKFNLMMMPPKAVISANLNLVENVIVRTIQYYEIRIDEILTRYDILIEKAE